MEYTEVEVSSVEPHQGKTPRSEPGPCVALGGGAVPSERRLLEGRSSADLQDGPRAGAVKF